MIPLERCPLCGGEMVEKDIEKVLRSGVHAATVDVRAEVCLDCGERLYSVGDVRRFEHIRARLEQGRSIEVV
ncbi:MAG: YgiT-type zinc finger protein [Thermoanaerobaculia bacterium]